MKTTNKLRNAFLITSFCLLNTISYGQTKEETISWLKEKFEKCVEMESLNSGNNYRNVKIDINECHIEVKAMLTYNGSEDLFNVTITMPTIGAEITKEGYIMYVDKLIKSTKIFFDSRSLQSYYGRSTKEVYFKLINNEDDILPRIQKALDHLATFCPKKKETF